MKKLFGLIAIALLAAALPLRAQQITLGFGASFDQSTTTGAAGGLDILVGDHANRSLTTVEMQGIGKHSPLLLFTGMEHTVYAGPRVHLNLSGAAGIAEGTPTTPTAIGGNGGGSIEYRIRPNQPFWINVAGGLTASAAIPGTYTGKIKASIRWVFNEDKTQ